MARMSRYGAFIGYEELPQKSVALEVERGHIGSKGERRMVARLSRYGAFIGLEELPQESVALEVIRGPIGSKGERMKVETETEKDELSEKARAAAWAWYQHGKGAKESTSRSRTLGNGEAKFVARPGEPGHKFSRFKIEAGKSSSRSENAPVEVECYQRAELCLGWDSTAKASTSGTSSLFDAYELGYVSKRIETAVQGHGHRIPIPTGRMTTFRPAFYNYSCSEGPKLERTPRTRDTGATGRPEAEAATVPDRSQDTSSSPKLSRSSTFRLQFPRYICSSLNDIVTQEEMARSVDVGKRDCKTAQATSQSDASGWSLRRNSRVHSITRS